ncbi:MAG: type II toxin-antitoxin system VapC family toxin [Propionibacteriaceae bacterium]|jgi:predicted nucleic acid-binding protein|nr:type II toxin-antitoxin system VapC family toxin [Propionibacteriaceae bacterium]
MPTSSGTIVVDCSAVVELLVADDPRGAEIAALINDAPLAAPTVLPYEVANVLRRFRNAQTFTTRQVESTWEQFSRLPIDLWPFDILAGRVHQLGGSLSSYDASYIALAELLHIPLLTCDAKLASSAPTSCQIIVPIPH